MKNILSTYKIIYNEIINCLSNNYQSIFKLISGFLLVLIIRSFFAIIDTIFIQEEFPIQRIIFIASTSLLIMGLEIGYTKFIFAVIDQKDKKISYIFNQFNMLGKYLSGILIFYTIIFVCALPCIIYIIFQYGADFFTILSSAILDPYFQELAGSYFNFKEFFIVFILFALPCIYIIIRLYFWSYFIIDKQLNGLDAIKTSWILTQNKSSEILAFSIALLVLNLLGAITLVGICITIPLSYLFICIYFRYLLSNNL